MKGVKLALNSITCNEMITLSIIYPVRSMRIDSHLQGVIQKYSTLRGVEHIVVSSDFKDTEDGAAHYFETQSRAERMNRGVELSHGELVLFHHPRSELEIEALEYLLKNFKTLNWGGFTHQFDKESRMLRFTSYYSNFVRADKSSIFYLDHCIYASRSLLEKIGPIEAVDIFEDTILSCELKKQTKGKRLPQISKTHSVRFERNGFWKQSILNQILKLKFHLGFDHSSLNKSYESGLDLNSEYHQKQSSKII